MALDLSGHPILEEGNREIEKRTREGDYNNAVDAMRESVDYMVDQLVRNKCQQANVEEHTANKISKLLHYGIIDNNLASKWSEIKNTRNERKHDPYKKAPKLTEEQVTLLYYNLVATEQIFISYIPYECTPEIPFEYLNFREKQEFLDDRIKSFSCVESERSYRKKDETRYIVRFYAKNFPERNQLLAQGWRPEGVNIDYVKGRQSEIINGEEYTVLEYDCNEEAVVEDFLRLLSFWDEANEMSPDEISRIAIESWNQWKKECKRQRKEYWEEKNKRFFQRALAFFVISMVFVGATFAFLGIQGMRGRKKAELRAAETRQELEQKQLLEKQLKEKKENAIREYTYADSFDTSVVKEPVDTWYHTGDLGTELGVGDVGYYNYEFTYIKDGGKEKAQVPVYYMLRNVKHGEDAISFLEDVNSLLRSDFRHEYIDNENFDKDKYEFVVAEFSVDDTEIYKYADKSEKIDSDSSYFSVRALDDKNWKDSSSTYKFGRCNLSMCSNHTPGECYSVYHIFCYEKGYDNYALSGSFGTHQWDKYCIPKSVVIG